MTISDLVERLRKHADDQIEDNIAYIQTADALMHEAADALTTCMEKQNARPGKEADVSSSSESAASTATLVAAVRASEEDCKELASEVQQLRKRADEAEAHHASALRGLEQEGANHWKQRDRATALQAQVEALTKALEPFAAENDIADDSPDNAWLSINSGDLHVAHCTVGDLRRARALLNQGETDR